MGAGKGKTRRTAATSRSLGAQAPSPHPLTPILKISPDGTKDYTLPDGRLHRVGGPATEHPDGSVAWCENGVHHRVGGPAIIDAVTGRQEWYQRGVLHREDGPAVECRDGSKEWWVRGEKHREDGPAEIRSNGEEIWWLNGEQADWETLKQVQAAKQKAEKETQLVNNLRSVDLGQPERVTF
jgi:hypothetical protein